MWVSAAGVRPPGRGEKGGEKGPGTSSGLALGLSRGGGGAAVEVGGQERVWLEGGCPRACCGASEDGPEDHSELSGHLPRAVSKKAGWNWCRRTEDEE